MGLDIMAYSRLRFVSAEIPDEYDDDDAAVAVYAGEIDRLGSMKPGFYTGLTLADLWWRGEHSGAPLPDPERERVDLHVAHLLQQRRAECPGDAAVLANPTFAAEQFSFRAGSYSGYGRWREALCLLALKCEPADVWAAADTFAGRPFVELINFSDAEGAIGFEAAARLARDFRSFETQAREHAEPAFYESYRDWQRAFTLAADEGVVIFC